MARVTRHLNSAKATPVAVEQVSGNAVDLVKGSASMYHQGRAPKERKDDRYQIAQRWQIDAYRQVKICGEARYAVTQFASLAARAEIGVSEPQTLNRKAVWVTEGPEVEAFAELAPTVRDRAKLIRDFMLHWKIAGECYLIARKRREQDPEYATRGNEPLWEIVAVTELRRIGDIWQVRLDNDNYVDLADDEPVIRMWHPDPENRREAWSPMLPLLPVLREIEWATGHIFTQIRSRLMSAGVWFLPNNLTYPEPPPDQVEGGAEAIAAMNEAERFAVALAASGSYELDLDEVSFPSVVLADAEALSSVDQSKLIKFWAEIDDKIMQVRNDGIRRFAIGFDLTPERVLGSSGIAVSGSSGSAGSVNHWGEWADEEKIIAGHIEPALSDFVSTLTTSFLRLVVEGTTKVISYDPESIRMKQDRSKEAIELRKMGLLNDATTIRAVGFDPEYDTMTPEEFRRFMLMKFMDGSPTPEMMVEALRLMGQVFPDIAPAVSGNPDTPSAEPKGIPGRRNPPSTKALRPKGPPEGDHEHKEAPYSAVHAACEVLVLRALEKAGARLLNEGKRGRDRDLFTPPHLAHVTASVEKIPDFDFSLLPTALSDIPASRQARIGGALYRYCADLYYSAQPYTRETLLEALGDL